MDTGIVFRRKGVEIKAIFENVVETMLSTNIASAGVKVRTVEHLLSAASGLGINNLIVDVDGPELPILDGSARGFVSVLLQADLVNQNRPQPYVRIYKPIIFSEGGSFVMAMPGRGFSVSYRLNYNHPIIREDKMDISVSDETYINEIAAARTFGFLKDVNALRARGLALGGSLENAVVIGDDGVLNAEGLRFKNEFVRHKILDTIGDVALFGCPIEGRIVSNESGHRMNVAFLRHLASNPGGWEVVADGIRSSGCCRSRALQEATV